MKTQDEKLKELNENELQETNGGQTPVYNEGPGIEDPMPGTQPGVDPTDGATPTDTMPWMQADR